MKRERPFEIVHEFVDCKHQCKNKQLCRHQCCKKGVPTFAEREIPDNLIQRPAIELVLDKRLAGYLSFPRDILAGCIFVHLDALSVARCMVSCRHLYFVAKPFLDAWARRKYGHEEADAFYLIYECIPGMTPNMLVPRCLFSLNLRRRETTTLSDVIEEFGASQNLRNWHFLQKTPMQKFREIGFHFRNWSPFLEEEKPIKQVVVEKQREFHNVYALWSDIDRCWPLSPEDKDPVKVLFGNTPFPVKIYPLRPDVRPPPPRVEKPREVFKKQIVFPFKVPLMSPSELALANVRYQEADQVLESLSARVIGKQEFVGLENFTPPQFRLELAIPFLKASTLGLDDLASMEWEGFMRLFQDYLEDLILQLRHSLYRPTTTLDLKEVIFRYLLHDKRAKEWPLVIRGLELYRCPKIVTELGCIAGAWGCPYTLEGHNFFFFGLEGVVVERTELCATKLLDYHPLCVLRFQLPFIYPVISFFPSQKNLAVEETVRFVLNGLRIPTEDEMLYK